jgi:hypothetical protein
MSTPEEGTASALPPPTFTLPPPAVPAASALAPVVAGDAAPALAGKEKSPEQPAKQEKGDMLLGPPGNGEDGEDDEDEDVSRALPPSLCPTPDNLGAPPRRGARGRFRRVVARVPLSGSVHMGSLGMH